MAWCYMTALVLNTIMITNLYCPAIMLAYKALSPLGLSPLTPTPLR